MSVDPAQFPTLKAKRTFELIVDLIKERVFSGDYAPGDRLPAERSLAEALGVGRASVREAYRALELLGVIEIRKGAEGGAFIQEPTQQSASETISDLLRLHNTSLSSLAEARLYIERGTAELAARRAQANDLERLGEIMARAEQSIAQGRSAAEDTIEFHLTLARISGNPILAMALKSIMELLRLMLRRLAPDQETARHEWGEHGRILEALRTGRAELAGELMDQHLRRSMQRLEVLAGRRRGREGGE